MRLPLQNGRASFKKGAAALRRKTKKANPKGGGGLVKRTAGGEGLA